MGTIAYRMCVVLMALLVASTILPPQAQGTRSICKGYNFNKAKAYMKTNTTFEFERCVDLPVLSSFLYWNFFPSNDTIEIAYRHSNIFRTTSKWVAWAHNPTGIGMVGSQCLVAHHMPDGSTKAYTAPITSYNTDLAHGPLSFNVSALAAVSFEHEMIIFATITLPHNTTTLTQVWQDGPLSSDGTPLIHETTESNVESGAILDLYSGPDDYPIITQGTHPSHSEKTVHGILCGVGWGILMPIGASIARQMRRFSRTGSAWFYLHVGCQFMAYIIGMAGWALGLKLDYDSPRRTYTRHRNIGITIFALGTVQMCALLVRPNKEHKYRRYWNRYHHLMGLTVMALSFANIFIGFKILKLSKSWFNTYYGIIISLILINVVLDMLYKKTESKENDFNQAQSGSYNVQRP